MSLLRLRAIRPIAAAALLTFGVSTVRAQNTAIVPAPFQPARHAQFLEIAQKGDIDLLLMGDSITDWWRRACTSTTAPAACGLDVFTKYFAGIKLANFGISGDKTQGVLWRMDNGELDGYTPKLMMLMIGTNNLSARPGTGNTPEEVAEGITAVVKRYTTKFPNAQVLLLGVFPRDTSATSPFRDKIKTVNGIIAKLDNGKTVRFMDIGDKFLEPNGSISVEVMRDGLHPTPKGYTIWAEAVMPTINQMLGRR